jgi:hypothetical protein
MGRRLSLGVQMRMMERQKEMGYHLQDGKSKTGIAWLLLTPQGCTSFTLTDATVKMQQSLTFSY